MAEWSERPHVWAAELAGPALSDQLSWRLSKRTRKCRDEELDLDASSIEETRRCIPEAVDLTLSLAVDPAMFGGPSPVRNAELLTGMMLTRIPQAARRRAGPSKEFSSSLPTTFKTSGGVNPWLSYEPHKARRGGPVSRPCWGLSFTV